MYTNGSNGNGNGNGNGHKRTKLTLSDLRSDPSDIATVEDFQETLGERGSGRVESPHEAATSPVVEKQRANKSLGEDDEDAGTDLLERDEKRGGWKRAVVGISIAASALFVIAIAAYFWLFSKSGNESYRVRNAATRSRAEAGARNDNSPQALTVEEIARELNRGGNSNNAANTNQEAAPNVTTNNNTAVNGGGSPITDRLPLGDFSTTVTPQTGASTLQPSQSTVAQNATGQSSQVDTTTGATTSRDATGTRSSATIGSPNPERSIRVSTLLANNSRESSSAASENFNRNQTASTERTESVPLPPLGIMLPVRTLGTLYTLRSEGYVRMQLTREVSGRGWSLARGTELYGVVRGTDFEVGRAYVQLVGFIDQASGRLVRLQGSLLGADGAEGFRGRKHNLNSGWGRALRIAGAGVAEALGTVAATVGRRPVYVGDIYGSGAPRVTSPLMQELNGIAYRQGRAGFVEVPAGASGYVLVMTPPREVQGVDANVGTPVDELRRSSDASRERAGTQLSETELAELMTSGNAEDIRRALPRMTPEMRRVAEAVLAGQ